MTLSERKSITNNYKASSETAKRILGEDMDKFNEIVLKHSQSLGSVQDFVDKVASVKGLSSEDLADIRKYTISLLNYNGYVDYVQSRIDEETRRRMDDIGRTANKDMGQVVTVKFPSSDQPVYITGGNIVLTKKDWWMQNSRMIFCIILMKMAKSSKDDLKCSIV